MGSALKLIGKYKYLLLVLLFGLILMLLPSRETSLTRASGTRASDTEARLEEVLCGVEGVGRTSVLCSDEGVVVVCEGAESAAVRLSVVRAVSGYTGLRSDRIEVLKMQTD